MAASPTARQTPSKPPFQKPSQDFSGCAPPSSGRQRPPRLPSGVDPADLSPTDYGFSRTSPEPSDKPAAPVAPQSARGASPSPLQRRLFAGSTSPTSAGYGSGVNPPPPMSRGGASTPSSAGSAGYGGLGLTGRGSPASTISRPGTAGSPEMYLQGYIPTSEYVGIMALNKEFRENNKELRAEHVNVKVEQESLRAEEAFLRGQLLKAGLTPPAEVSCGTESG
eukprot:TRINITY_DN111226_c0_g1_i1.p1 TRINITY_DN111226_c0_g1~~TRINITY_DN111226_c0_g1_i1.p1  ORF type:complete len:223 (+),score=49.51 TRINITY_DN111226_c0_g1_i1:40-708(+)